ncbi:MAG: glycosyltransferase [Caldilineaceae bacterium]|nr:glycosyltransferase [Caldilineaceae bacterium]
MKPEISVIICTHDRPQPLAAALETLAQQRIDLCQVEVIVVENSTSPASTERLVDNFQPLLANLRCLHEPRTGLSHARNRGWRAAQAAYVAYVDDDCKVPPQWLKVARQIIVERQPAIFGGPFFAYYDKPKALWYRDAYGSRHFGGSPRCLADNETLFGGNLFVNRTCLEALDGFAIDLGMSGRQIAYGEDTVFQQELRKRYPDVSIYYDPALFVYHLVRAEKISLSWSARSFIAKGRFVQIQESNGAGVLPHADAKIGMEEALVRAAKLAIGILSDITIGLLTRDRARYPYFQNYLYEHTGQYLRGVGRLSARLQQRRESEPAKRTV